MSVSAKQLLVSWRYFNAALRGGGGRVGWTGKENITCSIAFLAVSEACIARINCRRRLVRTSVST